MPEQTEVASAENVAEESLELKYWKTRYETRLSEALSKQDVGEKYLALKSCGEYFAGETGRNKKEIHANSGVLSPGGSRVGFSTPFSGMMVVGALGFALATIAQNFGAAVLSDLMFVITPLASIAGAFVATELHRSYEKKDAKRQVETFEATNKILKGFSNKVGQEMHLIEEQAPVSSLVKSSQVETLMTMEPFNGKLAKAFKAANTPTNSNDSNASTPNPSAKQPKP